MIILPHRRRWLQLEYEGVITSGDLHIATRDGEAMFFHDSIDFSAYAGNDAGWTPFRFVLFDNAGKVATAYGGAVGGGEALGSELVTDGDMEAADMSAWALYNSPAVLEKNTVDPIAGLRDLHIVTSGTSYEGVTYPNKDFLAGRLHYASITYRRSFGRALCAFGATSFACFFVNDLSTSVNTVKTQYVTPYHDSDWKIYIAATGGPGAEVWYDDFSVKPLTDIPATGLHLISAKNGTTRNMASVETGFNPNAIVGVKIYG